MRFSGAYLLGLLIVGALLGLGPEPSARVISVASRLLDEAQISYVYGGYQVGDGDSCKQCNACLTDRQPAPSKRLIRCPVCNSCSLDCSHFTELVYREAGLPYPYLETAAMASLSAETLKKNYQLQDLGTDIARSAPGDLLVYDGHVVLLERRHDPVPGQPRFRGDVVHATGGKDIRRPGEGIQRERFIDLAHFRGPVRRILRRLEPSPLPKNEAAKAAEATSPKVSALPLRKLRPVAKQDLGTVNDN